MTRLSKAQVEALFAGFDAEPVVALTIALRIALDAPTLDWTALLAVADFDEARRQRLLRGEQSALDGLAAELNELRVVAARTPPSRPAGADGCAPPSDTPPR